MGNCHAPFGKRATEKDPHHGHLVGVRLHSEGAGRSNAPGLPGDGRALRIETVINSPDDLGCKRRIVHLDEL